MMPTSLRPLRWVGSAKKDLAEMPEEAQDTFGYALHLAQAGDKHSQAKPLKGFGCGRIGSSARPSRRHLPRRVHGALRHSGVRAALLPEEIDQRHRHAQAGYGLDSDAIEGRGNLGKGVSE